jgi:hypothetical protein
MELEFLKTLVLCIIRVLTSETEGSVLQEGRN